MARTKVRARARELFTKWLLLLLGRSSAVAVTEFSAVVERHRFPLIFSNGLIFKDAFSVITSAVADKSDSALRSLHSALRSIDCEWRCLERDVTVLL